MEVVEACSKRKDSCTNTMACPCKAKYKRYVQPPRAKSFAPERVYKVPSKQLDDKTTYHLSYLNVDRAAARCARLQPIRPVHSFQKSTGKFFDETTNKLSYRPVWQIIKAEPILPKRRPLTSTGTMETVTTVRQDYVAKRVERPEMIIPCGNIRTSSAPLDDRTLARLSYVSPGPIEPVISFKPILKYRPSSQPLSKETTQNLSYQPFVIVKREFYPWAQKPTYKPPDITMYGKTTYSESYIENDAVSVAKPFVPVATYVFPYGAEFADKTIYKESYLPGSAERMMPFVPGGSISIPDARMSSDTTSKLSYQRVSTEKRKPFMPRTKTMLATAKMQSETTTRCEYVAKTTLRPDLIVPSDNIRAVDVPLEGDTTTGLSYVKPDVIKPVRSCKPVMQYYRPDIKIDFETINKLSYQTWTPKTKEELPWAQKGKYQAPEYPMVGDTVYHMSYPMPGHYVEDESCVTCPCPIDKQDNVSSAATTAS
ncbi:PREDICTED: uncharacterized protein LOC105563879 [Vollenhovia emeryi]|uniref:uncharacterized protein LOC105563879 n=1 Tax=Vollenhovia emeryi TaxID=411798 RepID=UPI0005F5233C|nr:PREDICTED: uncharacterized protein LOC105563879 [Vollenhovia emeryi]